MDSENPSGHEGRGVQGEMGLYRAWLCPTVCAKESQSSRGPQRPKIYPKILPCVKLSGVVHRQPRGVTHRMLDVPSSTVPLSPPAPRSHGDNAVLGGSHPPFNFPRIHVPRLFSRVRGTFQHLFPSLLK